MTSVQVNASRAYDVKIGAGLLQQAGEELLPFCANRYAAVMTDDRVDSLYGQCLTDSLERAGIRWVKHVIPHGEASKSGEQFLNALQFLADHHLTRTDLIIALGGGVVGDLTGFAAASYLRGVDFVQIPTTLLAMVDSSVGGKTAINLPSGKNLAGAFYQPRLVLCDYIALDTLEDDIFSDGCAEVIKYGVLQDKELFNHLQKYGKNFDRERVITACVKQKRDLVNQDETDHGVRQFLNLGHTFGHAIEQKSQFAVSHGKAVAIGMVMAAKGASARGICDLDCVKQIISVNRRFDLPVSTEFTADMLYEIMLSDKKRKGQMITVVLPETVGACRLQDLSVEELRDYLIAGLAE